jgi:hypothetical protein
MNQPSTDEWNFHRERIIHLYTEKSLDAIYAQMASENRLKATYVGKCTDVSRVALR